MKAHVVTVERILNRKSRSREAAGKATEQIGYKGSKIAWKIQKMAENSRIPNSSSSYSVNKNLELQLKKYQSSSVVINILKGLVCNLSKHLKDRSGLSVCLSVC